MAETRCKSLRAGDARLYLSEIYLENIKCNLIYKDSVLPSKKAPLKRTMNGRRARAVPALEVREVNRLVRSDLSMSLRLSYDHH